MKCVSRMDECWLIEMQYSSHTVKNDYGAERTEVEEWLAKTLPSTITKYVN